jgi:hypothetical protein
MPNIGIQAEANNIGTGNRIEPRQSDKSRALKIITDGTEMRTVVNEKNELTALPIPVRNMWWAQTMKERKPIPKTEKTIPL